MSYQNFSYYNGPNTSADWLASKGTQPFDDSHTTNIRKEKPRNQWQKPMASSDVANPLFKANSGGVGYAQSMILPSESHPVDPARPSLDCLHGTVTQLFSNFGYINDNIIFSKSDVVGQMVLVGDKVVVDAVYQPNNPTKYKGERVSKVEENRFASVASSNLGKMNTLTQGQLPRNESPPRSRPDKYGLNLRAKGSVKSRLKFDSNRFIVDNPMPHKTARTAEFKKARSKKLAVESAPRPRETVSAVEKYKETPKRVEEPKRRAEPVKRKAISPILPPQKVVVTEPSPAKKRSESRGKTIAKVVFESFDNRELDCANIKIQFPSLPLPSEFFHASLKYQQSFPLNHPMKLGNSCHFKVFDKRVKSADKFVDAQLTREVDPADADTAFVAKVMLLSTDDLAKFYKETLTLAEEFDGAPKLPITKAIKFLVGNLLGKNFSEFAIGGAWSASLDGADPETNPRVLINTAIRTCKAATGIDLSGCSSWPKFLELHYYRPLQKLEKKNLSDKEGEVLIDLEATEEYREPRMETVVYFIPDVWNCVPSQESWNEQRRQYQEQLACIMCPPPPAISPVVVPAVANTEKPSADQPEEEKKSADDGDGAEEEDYSCNEMEEEVEDKSENSGAEQPTHHSKLVVAGMKIVEIKRELELRKMNTRGVMEQLKARLKAALEKEDAEDKNKDSSSTSVKPAAAAAEKTFDSTLSEEQKNELKKLYALPDRPEIIVHQNRRICKKLLRLRTMSLHSLLSYHQEDKLSEVTFELALFARQFLQMLRRDAVFNIYKSIVVAPEADLASNDDAAKKAKAMITTSKRTVNRPLLFSCTLMDRDHRGRLPLDDLRSQIESLGICLSTKQLSSVLDKVQDKSHCLPYRLLTDREVSDVDITALAAPGAGEDLDYIKELALGNKALFDSGDAPAALDPALVDSDGVERLKNELDKSERCRQWLELRVSELRDEAVRGVGTVQAQAADIERLKEQAAEYRGKYYSEQDRGDRYKKEVERLMRYMRDIDSAAAGLNSLVGSVLGKLGDDKVVLMDLTDDGDAGAAPQQPGRPSVAGGARSGTPQAAADPRAQTPAGPTDRAEEEDAAEAGEAQELAAPPASAAVEDFDLSKPSDYDMIILDETD